MYRVLRQRQVGTELPPIVQSTIHSPMDSFYIHQLLPPLDILTMSSECSQYTTNFDTVIEPLWRYRPDLEVGNEIGVNCESMPFQKRAVYLRLLPKEAQSQAP